jgi:rare lipoprotein A
MQTKLRFGLLMFVASLLWTSPTSAATLKANSHKPVSPKVRYLGTASWYGKQHQGRKMANGQRFDRMKLTAASWYFPLGTAVRVVNVTNGESVVVTITDRGPNLRLHRILDLSEAAAQQLGYLEKGLAPIFLYPMVSLSTEAAKLDSQLVMGPARTAPVEYAAAIADTLP